MIAAENKSRQRTHGYGAAKRKRKETDAPSRYYVIGMPGLSARYPFIQSSPGNLILFKSVGGYGYASMGELKCPFGLPFILKVSYPLFGVNCDCNLSKGEKQ